MRKEISLFIGLFFSLTIAQAAVITVINTNDSGAGSLREAVANSNSNDIIRFDPSLLISGGNTIVLSSEIIIQKGLTIKGLYNSVDTLIISGNNNSRIFNITISDTMPNGEKFIRLDSLVLKNGNSIDIGGAILATRADSLVINNCVISYNSANHAGAISYGASDNGALNINNSNINNNSAITSGGAIRVGSTYHTIFLNINSSNLNGNTVLSDISQGYAYGGAICSFSHKLDLNLINSTMSSNSATSLYGYASGGAIYSDGNTESSITITKSTMSDNLAYSYSYVGFGGAISSSCSSYSNPSHSKVTVVSSTIVGNSAISVSSAGNSSASAKGGAIFSNAYSSSSSFSSNVTVRNSTIVNNMAASTSYYIYGGGIYSDAESGYYSYSTINVKGSIVADNGPSNIYSSSSPVISSQGYNIFSESISGISFNDMINVNTSSLNLLPLDFYGGTTKTMLPGEGSVAVDAGDSFDMTSAQNSNVSGGRRDIGAAENTNTYVTVNQSGCNEVIINGISYTNSQTVVNTYQNIDGYDSIVTTNITVNTINTSVSSLGALIESNENNALYRWLNCSNNYSGIIGAVSKLYTATTNGDYAVEITKNGCVDTSQCVKVFNASIQDVKKQIQAKIYPNPTSENLNINIINIDDKTYTLKLFNNVGSLILSKDLKNETTEISISNYDKGMYYLIVSNGDLIKTFPVVFN